MIRLNFPAYEFRFMEKDGKRFIFDPVRKKFVALTPEEWVRQHAIRYLVTDRKVPESLIKSESEIQLFKMRKRFDIAVFDRNGNALMVVECKAPSVPLSQDVLDQAVRYNLAMRVGYLMLTNGLSHVFCHIDPESNAMRLIENLPDYSNLS